MTLEEIIDKHNFLDIPFLVEEFYPDKREFTPVFLSMFAVIDEFLSDNKDISPSDFMIRVCKVTHRYSDDEFVSLIFDKNGWPYSKATMSHWIKSKIHYMTMELYDESEVFIRCLHAMAINHYSPEECEKIVNEYQKLEDLKKKSKDNSKTNKK
jgi:hypothetical protein